MKIELEIPIEDFGYESENDDYGDENHAKAMLDIITDKAAAQIISGYSYDTFSLQDALNNKIKAIEKHIEDTVTEKISKDSYKLICDKVTENVSDRITQRYERSQQYRDIKKEFEIENDSTVSSGLRTIISDIVKSEVKKIIKL